MRKSKKKNPDRAIFLTPGIYELYEAYPCLYNSRGYWLPSTKFIIEKRVEKIGEQKAYEYCSIRLLESKRSLFNSYHIDKWNELISRLIPENQSIDSRAEKDKFLR